MYTPLILNARIQFFELFNECAYPNVKELYLIHVYILLFIQIRIRKCYGDMKNIMLKLFCEPVVDMILKMLCQRCSSIICLGKYQKHHSYANKKDVTMGIPTFILFATYYLKCLRITVLPIMASLKSSWVYRCRFWLSPFICHSGLLAVFADLMCLGNLKMACRLCAFSHLTI